uniref:Uncharacterized protein n=1 Tax=Aegilops tauschii subsp. strangulata TaxID=200361 RepID=A0A453FA96_AEGTS
CFDYMLSLCDRYLCICLSWAREWSCPPATMWLALLLYSCITFIHEACYMFVIAGLATVCFRLKLFEGCI